MRARRRDTRPEPGPLVNERCLRYADVRLIGPNGEQVGIVQTRRALQMAEEANMDLVMVAPQVQPPVCKIVDFGKYKYEQKKLQKESKAKRKTQDVKGIKFRPGTAVGDLHIQLRKAQTWLEDGHKVRFVVQHRARELTHPEIGRGKLEWFLDQLGNKVQIEKPIGLDGNLMTMVVSPGKKPAGGSDVQAKDKQNSSEAV